MVPKEVSRRQIFHAQYCDFLNVDLTSSGAIDLLREALRITLSWSDQSPNPAMSLRGSPSLCIRIVNWLRFLVRNEGRAWARERPSDRSKPPQPSATGALSESHL
jgi:hypothetical protein